MPREDRHVNPPSFLRYGYWDYPDPERKILDLLGRPAAERLGFVEAMAAEEYGAAGAVLCWANSGGVPAPVRAIVGLAYEDGEPGWRFDETAVARLADPGSAMAGGLVVLARRRAGMIHYRVASPHGEVVFAPTGDPLALEHAYALASGNPAYLVAFGAEIAGRLLAAGRSPSPREIEAALMAHDRLLHVTSGFYEFSELERSILRGLIAQLPRRSPS
jgi:hypothetical protein